MLLFDQNLSHKLVSRLQDAFPDSIHVRDANLERNNDAQIWRFAHANKLHIVTLDRDFVDLANRFGHPPCVVWVRTGNTSTTVLEQVFRQHHLTLKAFLDKGKESVFTLP